MSEPGGKMRVLTTIPGRPEKFWGMNTTLADRRCARLLHARMHPVHRHVLALIVAVKMLVTRRDFDVLVVDGGPIGQWFTWLQSLLYFGRKPTLMIDCLWYVDSNSLVQRLKRLHKKLSALSVDRFLVWARHEIRDYSREFGISESKFAYVPFHITLEDYSFEEKDEEYVFAGGNGDRDYRVLVDAAQGTDIPVFIATTDMNLLAGATIPPNVTVRGVTHEEFRQRMAECRIAVVPMRGGLLHSGGQQTFLNSMYLGKPTVVVGTRVAEGYIDDGVNGIVVESGDVPGLRQALLSLWNSRELRSRIGEAGRQMAKSRTTTTFMQEIYGHAENIFKS
jgi:glycosyltransferase involved in cell wall biosynthesis